MAINVLDALARWFDYLFAHPLIAAGGAVGMIGILALLNRKPRLEREADAALRRLQGERGNKYDQLRPPH